MVAKKYTVPENMVAIKKNKKSTGGLLLNESPSIFSFVDIAGKKDAIAIYRLNKTKGRKWRKSLFLNCLLSETSKRM